MIDIVATSDYSSFLAFCRERHLNPKETVYVRTIDQLMGRVAARIFILADCEDLVPIERYAFAHLMEVVEP